MRSIEDSLSDNAFGGHSGCAARSHRRARRGCRARMHEHRAEHHAVRDQRQRPDRHVSARPNNNWTAYWGWRDHRRSAAGGLGMVDPGLATARYGFG